MQCVGGCEYSVMNAGPREAFSPARILASAPRKSLAIIAERVFPMRPRTSRTRTVKRKCQIPRAAAEIKNACIRPSKNVEKPVSSAAAPRLIQREREEMIQGNRSGARCA